jgi:hypothetical protein
VFLFAIYLAEISYVATSFENPLYAEEMNILDFLKQPDVTIIQALLLKFKPANMDVLPLYIILLLLFPPILWLLQFRATLALGASVLLYVLTWEFGWNMPSYPSGSWYFNPFAWQLLFVFGAWCAVGGAQRLSGVIRSPVTLAIAITYLAFAFVISLTWYLPGMSQYMPVWLEDVIYPIDKVNLDVLRFAHFLALAVVTLWFVPRDWPPLKSWWLWPAVVCGQHSLEIFCLGVFLSFAAHFAMVEVSGGLWVQVVASVLGIVIMTASAGLITWYKRLEGRSPGSRPRKTPDADLGREARPSADHCSGGDRVLDSGRPGWADLRLSREARSGAQAAVAVGGSQGRYVGPKSAVGRGFSQRDGETTNRREAGLGDMANRYHRRHPPSRAGNLSDRLG